jgi:hypothetical protein
VTEMVIAVFETASAADAAVQDLEVARIPSAVVQREAGGGQKRQRRWPSVRVAVGEMHALAVTGILDRYAPLELEERTARIRRR